MERLTEFYRNSDGTGISKKSLVIEEGLKKGMPSGYCGAIVTKLADYEDAEEQGLLLIGANIKKIAVTERNKAIDDFTKEIVAEYENDGCPGVTDYLDYRLSIRELFAIAEQMKGV